MFNGYAFDFVCTCGASESQVATNLVVIPPTEMQFLLDKNVSRGARQNYNGRQKSLRQLDEIDTNLKFPFFHL